LNRAVASTRPYANIQVSRRFLPVRASFGLSNVLIRERIPASGGKVLKDVSIRNQCYIIDDIAEWMDCQ